MAPLPLYKPKPRHHMRVACFMSGSGTNAQKVIERGLMSGSSYRVELIFTDVKDEAFDKSGKKVCRALEIARERRIAYECLDILDFYRDRGHSSKKDLSLRPEYDKAVVERIEKHRIDLIVLAGYMSITTAPLLQRYGGRIINVHPADLTLMTNGERRYVGIHTVRDAILDGQSELRASTHIVREKVDYGEILVISRPVEVSLPSGVNIEKLRQNKELLRAVVEEHQSRLKRIGDWVILPLTVQMLGDGRFSVGDGEVYLDGTPIPYGFRL